jgi:hypothetical protein
MRVMRLRFASMLVEAMRAGSSTPALAMLLTVGHAAVLGAEPILCGAHPFRRTTKKGP